MKYEFPIKNIFKPKIKDKGFAIPQILILGIGIAVGISGIMSASILGLLGSKISRQELLAKAASYSGITYLRALFNENVQGRLINYFWIVDNCSENAKECDTTTIQNPSNQFWTDESWCNGEENCNGRRKAPLCPSSRDYSWSDEQSKVKNLFSSSVFRGVGNGMPNAQRNFFQSYNIISSKYIGTENRGINSILIEGLAIPVTSDKKTASNKLRVNIQVEGQTSEAGFGFISAGENNADKQNSLFLGNLSITSPDTAKGSIIWRMNLENINDCKDFKVMAKGEDALLPQKGNGAIWAQPLSLPKQPRLKNVIDLGTLICTETNIAEADSNCKLNADNLPQKTYRINSLFARGPGSQFEVSTTKKNKIILEIMGDIDISNEGIFCHRNGLENCGSGKPENLTILFKQNTNSEENKLICNRENDNGGVIIENNEFTSRTFPLNNDLLPGHSFLIDNRNTKFGAFIYGPKTTLLSSLPNSNYVQIFRKNIEDKLGMIVISRGAYGYINNSSENSLKGNITNLILNPEMKLIPYGSSNNLNNNREVIAIGRKVRTLPPDSLLSADTNKVFLIYDNSSSNYHLRSFDEENINYINKKSMQNSFPGSFAILRPKNSQNDKNLGNNLDDSPYVNSWLEAFGISLKKSENDSVRKFTGAAWVKNFCLDNEGEKTWEFSKDFIKGLISWHGESFNWGIKSYRGRSIILWDTLRNFD